jgi:hypothetical protein
VLLLLRLPIIRMSPGAIMLTAASSMTPMMTIRFQLVGGFFFFFFTILDSFVGDGFDMVDLIDEMLKCLIVGGANFSKKMAK